MPILSKLDIQTCIPHRAPILLVDEVLDYILGEHIITQRYFPADDPCFEGHFPDYPILPGVLIVEAMAQSAAVLTSLTENVLAKNMLFLFTGIEKARFKAPVHPNDTVTFDVRLIKHKASIYWFEGQARCKQQLCASASFSAKLVPHE